jgi:predicted RNase H-like HicB family nuclease
MKRYVLTCKITREESEFVAYCPEFDIHTTGVDVEDALKAARDMILGYIEACDRQGILSEILARVQVQSDEPQRPDHSGSWRAVSPRDGHPSRPPVRLQWAIEEDMSA